MINRRSPLLLPPPMVVSEIDPEVASVVAYRVAPEVDGIVVLEFDTPVAVTILAAVAATKAATS